VVTLQLFRSCYGTELEGLGRTSLSNQQQAQKQHIHHLSYWTVAKVCCASASWREAWIPTGVQSTSRETGSNWIHTQCIRNNPRSVTYSLKKKKNLSALLKLLDTCSGLLSEFKLFTCSLLVWAWMLCGTIY
jgi:hypothetical protein